MGPLASKAVCALFDAGAEWIRANRAMELTDFFDPSAFHNHHNSGPREISGRSTSTEMLWPHAAA